MEAEQKKRSGPRLIICIIVIVAACISMNIERIMNLFYPLADPTEVFTSKSPDGTCAVSVVEHQVGRVHPSYNYFLNLKDQAMKPLPGQPFGTHAESRLSGFSAKWTDKGVELSCGMNGRQVMAYGKANEGKQEWRAYNEFTDNLSEEVKAAMRNYRAPTRPARTTSEAASRPGA